MDPRARFDALADAACGAARPGEVVLVEYYGEASDFVRLNRARIRQAGHVLQHELRVELIAGARHAAIDLTPGGDPAVDAGRVAAEIAALRALLPHLPEDPYLNHATACVNSEETRTAAPGDPADWLAATGAAAQHDLVGILAGGPQWHGFANSLGQRNWLEDASYNFDWSLHDAAGRAVKGGLAGRDFAADVFAERLRRDADTLALLARPAVPLATGRHRAYLAPAALGELLAMLSWGGFSTKALRTRQSPLQRLADGQETLHPDVSLVAEPAVGTGPAFSAQGFVVPPRVELVRDGRFGEALCGARSAAEFGLPVNARGEFPDALAMAPGTLPVDTVLAALGDGLYVSDLWYCNYSDRNRCRVTGMTRYACVAVRDGAAAGPIEAMRFDDSLYDLLGDRLVGLTRERERLADAGSYGRRDCGAKDLPGLLVDGLELTL